MRKAHFILLWLLSSCPIVAIAQSPFQLTTDIHYGKIVRHSKKFKFEPPPPSMGTEIRAEWQLNGARPWHEWTGFPRVGVAAMHYHIGDRDTFGDAFALFPLLTVKVFGNRRWRMNYGLGSGIAYLTQRFHPINNPTFNAIGSHLNNITTMRFDAQFQPSPQLQLFGGLSLVHFSNGGSQLPNSGINFVGGHVGGSWTFKPTVQQSWEKHQAAKGLSVLDILRNVPRRRFGVSVRYDLAFSETSTWAGPRYPVHIAAVSGVWHRSKTRRTHLGIEAEQNQSVFHFFQDIRQTDDVQKDRISANRTAIFGAEEFVFGNWSIYLQPSYYVSRSWSGLIQGKFYNKLGFRVFTPPLGRSGGQLFGGVYMKAHMFTAEYISLGGGAIF